MKIQVVFQNLKKSEFIKSLVVDRVQSVLEKFPQNRRGKAVVYVSMENSPRQAGPDLFGVKVMLKSSIARSMVFSKKAGSLFQATADVADGLLESMHRQHDKMLDRERDKQRRWKSWTHKPTAFEAEPEAS
jgi:ribosome-associated translation inhibitor RaiA